MRRVLLALLFIILGSTIVHAAAPAQLQHRGCPAGGSTLYTEFDCPLPNKTLAGNIVVVGLQYGVNASNTATVTDENSDTFTKDICGTTGDTNQTVCLYHSFVTTGSHLFKATNSSNSAFMMMWSSEYNNISGVDNCQSGTGSSTGPTTSANMTFAASGDLIVQLVEQDSTGNVTSWTAGSHANITWNMSQNDIGYSSGIDEAAQWGVYSSTTAFAPSLTMSPTNQWNTVACGFTTNSSGNPAPAGLYITSMEHYNVACPTGCASGFKLGAPLTGNTAILECIDAPNNGDIASISATGGETWAQVGSDLLNDAGGGILMVWAAKNATLVQSDVLTITTGTPAGSTTSNFTSADCIIYGISGAAVNPIDTSITAGSGTTCTSGLCTTSGNDTVAETTQSAVIATPSTSTEILITQIGVGGSGGGAGDVRSCTSSPTGILSDTAYSPQEATANEMDENNGKCNDPISSGAAVTVTWTLRGSITIGNWASTLIGIKAGTIASGMPPMIF